MVPSIAPVAVIDAIPRLNSASTTAMSGAPAPLADCGLALGRLSYLSEYLWVQRDAEGAVADVFMRRGVAGRDEQ